MQFFTVRFIGSISAAGGRRAYFNSRSSARGDGWWARYAYHYTISIHAPPRGATPHARRNGRIDGLFQFTPLREGRRGGIVRLQSGNQFQFTPLREGRRTLEFQLVCQIHFNSRPSARGDIEQLARVGNVVISIHAPPRGATQGLERCKGKGSRDFNSRPSARGDARAGTMQRERQQRFQFTPLREGRRACWLAADGANISIHAPPRGATDDVMNALKPILFQFTPLREGRPSAPATKKTRWRNFNSRPSARGDVPAPEVADAPEGISIHAPPRGATCTTCGHVSSSRFQFTPLREGRRCRRCHATNNISISIHAPPRGATRG